jgi:hypothetical protein
MGLRLRLGRRRRARRAKPGRRKKAKGRGRVLKVVKYQTGRSNIAVDRRYRALPPGKRRSRRGRIYWETRKNRSDMPGRLV